MKSKIGRVLFLLVVLVAAINALSKESKAEAVNESMLQRVADKTNQDLPSMPTPVIRAEKTTVGPGLKWNFTFTLLDQKSSPEVVESVTTEILSLYKDQFCVSPDFSVFLENNVTIELNFLDKDRQPIVSKQLTKETCKAST